MANDRPSARPTPGPWWKPDNGYWMANSGAGLPTDVWQDWLTDMLGGHGGNALNFPQGAPVFPEGGPAGGAAQPSDYDTAGARPQNALVMAQAASPEIDIQGHAYEAIPANQFNHNLYDRMELYTGQGARPNPPSYLIGNDPAEKPTPDNIKYWRRKQPFAGS